MTSRLEDLDELILKCRDANARTYISEAVANYKVGAFRSSIVSTWIAVCFDVIDKIKELALAGDIYAEQKWQEIEQTRRSADIVKSLKFEKELLDLAEKNFELISHIERIDLARLQEDRNRCAHPSLSNDELAYLPSAELARLHINSAVSHLLQHPPVQGKYALDRLLKEINSDYFPTEVSAVKIAFGSGPLKKPRESLVRNLVIVLCKELLTDSLEWKRRAKLKSALECVKTMHFSYCDKVLKEKLSVLFRTVQDNDFVNLIRFFESISDIWQYIDFDIRLKMERYVENLPANHFDEIDFLLKFEHLRSQALKRVKYASKKDLMDSSLLFLDVPSEIIDRIIELYLRSSSFNEANEIAKSMTSIVDDMSAEHIRNILKGASKNSQIIGSNQLGILINAMRSKNKISNHDFDEILTKYELKEYLWDDEIPF